MALSSEEVWRVLAAIEDPEIPGLSIVDLGIVRGVAMREDSLRVSLTPTYSGCPAFKFIEDRVVSTFLGRGFKEVEVDIVLSPPWTSDWLSEAARNKLRAIGIAPPAAALPLAAATGEVVNCPFCGSVETELRSEFGSTSCRALHYCKSCEQPFEHFKSI